MSERTALRATGESEAPHAPICVAAQLYDHISKVLCVESHLQLSLSRRSHKVPIHFVTSRKNAIVAVLRNTHPHYVLAGTHSTQCLCLDAKIRSDVAIGSPVQVPGVAAIFGQSFAQASKTNRVASIGAMITGRQIQIVPAKVTSAEIEERVVEYGVLEPSIASLNPAIHTAEEPWL